MTLFLLLAAAAALMPMFAVGFRAAERPWTATACGFLVAVVFCVGQLVLHHWLVSRLVAGLRRVPPVLSEIAVAIYYVLILSLGVLCAWLADYVAQVS